MRSMWKCFGLVNIMVSFVQSNGRKYDIGEAELQMVTKLVEEISEDFRDDYKSNYEGVIKELIRLKSKKKEIVYFTCISVSIMVY
jgi:non-homologous end joining protein Ku